MDPMNLDLNPDVIDPATENWSEKDDAEVWHAAEAGIPQAIAELARRGL